MLPKTIETSVAPETIAKVGRLFNGTPNDILNELLQNARRASASRVAITTNGTAGDRLIHIVDDGCGIADPTSIVTLGRSGWSAETQTSEGTAGMGFFALAGRDVIVRSWSKTEHQGWMAHIPAGAWESSRPIAIESDPIASGTAITIRMPEAWWLNFEGTVRDVAHYYPLPVTLNGSEVEQRGWLDGAVRIEDWNGCRIGVFREYPYERTRPATLNFHGVRVPLSTATVSEIGRGRSWCARVDIVDCPDIHLVLPARKEAVANAKLDQLKAEILAAIYRTIAMNDSHRLSHESWTEAKALGIELAEAEPYLRRWIAPQANSSENYQSGTQVTDPSMIIMPDVPAIIAQPAALAIEGKSPFKGALVAEEPAFEGYAWYDGLARLNAIGFEIAQDDRTFFISDESTAPSDAAHGYVDAITLTATVSHSNQNSAVRCQADIAIAFDHEGSDEIDDVAIFVRRGSGTTTEALLAVTRRAVFYPGNDCGDDTPDTQLERFNRAATDRVVEMLEGTDAAIEVRVRDLLDEYRWMLPTDRQVSVHMTKDALDVVVTERAAGDR